MRTKKLFKTAIKDSYTYYWVKRFTTKRSASECRLPVEGTNSFISIVNRKVYLDGKLIPKHLY